MRPVTVVLYGNENAKICNTLCGERSLNPGKEELYPVLSLGLLCSSLRPSRDTNVKKGLVFPRSNWVDLLDCC